MAPTDQPGPAMLTESEIVEIGARALAEESTGVLWDQMSAGQRAAEIARSKREIRAALAALREAGLVLEQGWRFDMENAPEHEPFLAFVSPQGRYGVAQICVVRRTEQQILSVPGGWARFPTAWRRVSLPISPAPPTDKGGA